MSTCWLISSEALQRRKIREIREARSPLAPIVARAPMQRQADAAPAPPRALSVANGVATIRVEGVLTPTPDLMAEYYGEPNTTYADLQESLAVAAADPEVREVVWSINSPGGMVTGLFALLDDIADARASGVRMSAIADEAQSAAYGIAAAVGKITATSRLSQIGSVGVAVSYFMQGGMCGEVVDLTSSDAPDKRPNLKTDEGRAVVVRHLDEVADEFMSAIAAGRGTTAAAVAAEYGRGASMLAKAAKAAGMIDDIAPRSSAYARTLTDARKAGSVPASMSEKIEPTPTAAVEAPALEAVATLDIPVTVDTSALDALAAERAELAAFRAERAERETAERRALVTDLVALKAETPATAWANGAPVPRLATEPLASLRDRVIALRTAASGKAQPTPPAGAEHGEESLEDFERRDAAKIKDPEARARFVASRIARKQKAQ